MPGGPWSYGLGANQARFAARPRRIESTRDFRDPFVYLFAEHQDVLGAALNVTVGNVLGQNEGARREVYGDLGPGAPRGPLLFAETRDRTFGPILEIRLSDTF